MPPAELPSDPPAVIAQMPASSFDLAAVPGAAPPDGVDTGLRLTPRRCAASSADEIVVCAPDPEANRVRPLPDTYVQEEGLPRARLDLGGGANIDVHLDSATLANGVTSQRVMVGIKLGF